MFYAAIFQSQNEEKQQQKYIMFILSLKNS